MVNETTVTDSLVYEDGSVEKKTYGEDNSGSIIEVFVHLIERNKQEVQTVIASVELGLTVAQFLTLLEEKTKIALNSGELKTKIEGEYIKKEENLKSFLNETNEDKPELFLFYGTFILIQMRPKQL